jgi:non-specific serine/threonine protein kinase/serine/threonine-protein kinase
MNNLAKVYWSQGKYARAEALYGQTMDIQRRVLGPEHPGTLLSMGFNSGFRSIVP